MASFANPGELRHYYRPRFEDLVDTQLRLFHLSTDRRNWLLANVATSAFCGVGGVVAAILARIPLPIAAAIGVFLAAFAYFHRSRAPLRMVRRFYRLDRPDLVGAETELLLTSEAAVVSVGDYVMRLPWKSVTGIRRSKNDFEFINQQHGLAVIRRSYFDDDSEWERFWEFAQAQWESAHSLEQPSDEPAESDWEFSYGESPEDPSTGHRLVTRFAQSRDELIDQLLRVQSRMQIFKRQKQTILNASFVAFIFACAGLYYFYFDPSESVLGIELGFIGLFVTLLAIWLKFDSFYRNSLVKQLAKMWPEIEEFPREVEFTDEAIIVRDVLQQSLTILPWNKITEIREYGDDVEIHSETGELVLLRYHHLGTRQQAQRWIDFARDKAVHAEFVSELELAEPEPASSSDNPFRA